MASPSEEAAAAAARGGEQGQTSAFHSYSPHQQQQEEEEQGQELFQEEEEWDLLPEIQEKILDYCPLTTTSTAEERGRGRSKRHGAETGGNSSSNSSSTPEDEKIEKRRRRRGSMSEQQPQEEEEEEDGWDDLFQDDGGDEERWEEGHTTSSVRIAGQGDERDDDSHGVKNSGRSRIRSESFCNLTSTGASVDSGSSMVVCWVYMDEWGNEIPYARDTQALLEHEWRAGRVCMYVCMHCIPCTYTRVGSDTRPLNLHSSRSPN